MKMLQTILSLLLLLIPLLGEATPPSRQVVHPPIPPRPQALTHLSFKSESQIAHLITYLISSYLSRGEYQEVTSPPERTVASIANFPGENGDGNSELRSAEFSKMVAPTSGWSQAVAKTSWGKRLPPPLLKVFDDPQFISEIMKITENQTQLSKYQGGALITSVVLFLIALIWTWRMGFFKKILARAIISLVFVIAHAAVFNHFYPKLGKIVGTAILASLKSGVL